MEKFYIVNKDTELYKDYFDWKANMKAFNEKAIEFLDKWGIEATQYVPRKTELIIDPTENDEVKFKEDFTRREYEGLKQFKVRSDIGKAWVEHIKDMSILSRPTLFLYFRETLNCSSRLFHIQDELYCTLESKGEFGNPKGLTEIKGSEFYKIIEEYEASLETEAGE